MTAEPRPVAEIDQTLSRSPYRVFYLVVAAAFVLCLSLSIGGAYLVGSQAKHEAVTAAQQALRAEATAQEGRSKALCGALKQLATTKDAHLLHPDLLHVYDTSGCPRITGPAS